jgi:antitoxin (DNA-binding transcriptional repressor) of toxin-antitoxin stability system
MLPLSVAHVLHSGMIKTANLAKKTVNVKTTARKKASVPPNKRAYAKTPKGGEITQRELRNASGQVMRALDAGASFIVTRNGVPVGELKPFQLRGFVSKAAVRLAFQNAPPVNFRRFQADLDSLVDQDATPRG